MSYHIHPRQKHVSIKIKGRNKANKTCHHPRHQDHNYIIKPKQDHITNACTLRMHDLSHLPYSNLAPMALCISM